MKKIFTITLALCLLLNCSVYAATDDQLIDSIIDHMAAVNRSIGQIVTTDDLDVIKDQVETAVYKYQQKGYTRTEALEMLFKEIQTEAPLPTFRTKSLSIRSSGGSDIGDTKLPSATKGDIFFVDNSMPYNHVGIYASSTTIVESMPKDGVQYWSIDNIESYQSPHNGSSSNESCILRVDTTSSNRYAAANWAKNSDRLGTPYDYDFLDNKSDHYYVNLGTPQFPNYVQFDESDAYNCSELVWKSYKKTSGINLDSNGGLAVYPNNIYNSSKTESVQTWGQ